MNPEGTDGNHIGCGILKELPKDTEFEHVLGEKPDCTATMSGFPGSPHFLMT